jgi:hypothetical protein
VETQFDTSVVAAFEAVLAGATEAYRAGHQHDFDWLVQQEEHGYGEAVAAAAS